ncbi:hypothetical protein SADUNF_Sadunf12G0037200 [Salix dunnii]|uniref:Uncharacterized protein n=1 Tax=Salix dunnii TaxID=1413687 RepID=A0A835JLC2_9ROSI|nr:hypothetical protein SADUNF_Sadunf12G0037200 [Salix dunnii]
MESDEVGVLAIMKTFLKNNALACKAKETKTNKAPRDKRSTLLYNLRSSLDFEAPFLYIPLCLRCFAVGRGRWKAVVDAGSKGDGEIRKRREIKYEAIIQMSGMRHGSSKPLSPSTFSPSFLLVMVFVSYADRFASNPYWVTDLPRLKYISLLLLPADADCIYRSAGICNVFQADGSETRVLISFSAHGHHLTLFFPHPVSSSRKGNL